MIQGKGRICPGCRAEFPIQEGPAHRYGVASPECWAAANQLFAKEYEHRGGYPPIHRLTVDAYSVQHPPQSKLQKQLNISERFIKASHQSIAVHLIGLYLALEQKTELTTIARLMDRILSQGVEFEVLEQPDNVGKITVVDILAAKNFDAHTTLVWQWAENAWQAWSAYRGKVRRWCDHLL